MYQLCLVRKLHSLGHLPNVGNGGVEREQRPFRVQLSQVATRSVVHHQKGGRALHTKVQHLDDMGMPQPGKGTGLAEKAFHIMICQLSMKYFNSGLGLQMNVLAKVDGSEVPLP